MKISDLVNGNTNINSNQFNIDIGVNQFDTEENTTYSLDTSASSVENSNSTENGTRSNSTSVESNEASGNRKRRWVEDEDGNEDHDNNAVEVSDTEENHIAIIMDVLARNRNDQVENGNESNIQKGIRNLWNSVTSKLFGKDS